MSLSFETIRIEEFEWDKGNLKHIQKHTVTYAECEEVFTNKPFFVNEDKIHSKTEQRLQALGRTNQGRFIFIVFTIRKNKLRIISARDQNKKEKSRFK